MNVTIYPLAELAGQPPSAPEQLALSITRAASRQTYYTVRLLVDRDRMQDAFRAYAYFRWVDDQLDGGALGPACRRAFIERQSRLVERLYRGEPIEPLLPQECLLADLIAGDRRPGSGLQAYICHMMSVMTFDAERRGRVISAAELESYTGWLAAAVTEALHTFIGGRCSSPGGPLRYRAATGAHIAHMLRDTLDDLQAGYINIPREVIEAGGIDPRDVHSAVYRSWVRRRVALARACFRDGREHLAQVRSLRCRLAGYAYIARFEAVLDRIERDGCRLRAAYPARRSPASALRMGWSLLRAALKPPLPGSPRRLSVVEG